ncbi:hypothetical protein C8R44DRAFT_797897 [Mycena epipterygia]|nr:hypothetical protein C8R44DRAFT_797897 [Mycena epipterygia]
MALLFQSQASSLPSRRPSRKDYSFPSTEYERKVAKLQGGFMFHAHHTKCFMFFLAVTIELQGLDIDKVMLNKGNMFVVPRGVQHRPVVEEGIAEVLLIEKAGAMNTGDAVGVEHLIKVVEDARG